MYNPYKKWSWVLCLSTGIKGIKLKFLEDYFGKKDAKQKRVW